MYVSRRPLLPLSRINGEQRLFVYTDGTRVDQTTSAAECPGTGGGGVLEVQPDGRRLQVCSTAVGSFQPGSRRTRVSVLESYQLLPDGTFRLASVDTSGRPVSAIPTTVRLEIRLPAVVPMLVAGIDPAAEARLSGLDRAVRQGRYLTGSDTTGPATRTTSMSPFAPSGPTGPTLPVLAARDLAVDEQMDLAVSRLAGQTASRVPGATTEALWPLLRDSAKAPGRTAAHDLGQLYRARLDTALADNIPLSGVQTLLRPAPPAYTPQADGIGRILPRTGEPGSTDQAVDDVWRDAWLSTGGVGTGEPINLNAQGEEWSVTAVGSFAMDALPVAGGPAQQALDLYRQAPPVGADPRTRQLLADRPLLPGDDPLGYPSRPPHLLT
ncbi:hypothetical protein EAD89_29180, partial [Micromonospora sp. BL4]